MIERDDLIEYVARVHERTRDAISAIPSDLLTWRPREGEFSMAELAVHIANARVWNARLVTGDGTARYAGHDATGHATTASLLELADSTSQHAIALITAADFDAMIPSSMGEIEAWRRVMGGLIEHEVHHRSQLCALLSQNGIQPPALYGLFEEQLPR
ncbi:DinB family protein [bacterium]|nr:DinB family protein [bacterium]